MSSDAPNPSTNGNPPASSEGLRQGIDRGAARDKVAAPDPAAAPLGTDDEAAGTPPAPARRALAAEHELERRPTRHDTPATPRGMSPPLWLAWGLAALLVVVACAGWFVSR